MAASGNMNENVPVDEYKNINTTPFHIGSFVNEWLMRLDPTYYSYKEKDETTFDQEFVQESGIAPETLKELKAICSLDSLRCHPNDETPDTELVPPDPQLQTLIQRMKKQDYRSTLKIDKICKHALFSDGLESLRMGKRPENPIDLIHEGEIILTINSYYPAIFERFRLKRPVMTLQVLGSQYLTELRDAICCVSDLHVFGEFSDTPDIAPGYISKDHHKSSFFYFEHIFYNDMRFPECRDISSTTREWAESRGYPPFRQAKMEDTRFTDLTVKVGHPYLYCHQGDCEHLIIITDVRFVHKDDCLDRRLYPLLIHKHIVMTKKCAVCRLYIARWLTTNDEFAPVDPCLFCENCFRTMHYDDKGVKMGDFRAYVYVDPGAFN